MNILFRSICMAAFICLIPQIAAATTWELQDIASLVRNADIIVSGRVIRVEEPAGEIGAVGVIEISEVIYGNPELKEVRLILNTEISGSNKYQLGDEGLWFLTRYVPRRAVAFQQRTKEARARFPDGWFVADHPSTFWTLQDAFGKRNPSADAPADKDTDARRKAELFRMVTKRIEADVRKLTGLLDAAKKNLAHIEKRAATQPTAP